MFLFLEKRLANLSANDRACRLRARSVLSQLDATNFPATVMKIVASGRTAETGRFVFFQKATKTRLSGPMAIAKIGELRHKLIGDLLGREDSG